MHSIRQAVADEMAVSEGKRVNAASKLKNFEKPPPRYLNSQINK